LRRKTNGSPEGKRKKREKSSERERAESLEEERERGDRRKQESLLGRGTNESSRSVNCDKKKGNEI
jgi:hypothetical protein